MRIVSALLGIACLAGCAETLTVRSHPAGAQVLLDRIRIGTTPVDYDVPRSQIDEKHVRIELEGYKPHEQVAETRVAPGRVVAAIFTLGLNYSWHSPRYYPEIDVKLERIAGNGRGPRLEAPGPCRYGDLPDRVIRNGDHVAVMEFRADGIPVGGAKYNLAGYLGNALSKRGQVTVVDRARIDQVLKELGLSKGGAWDPNNAPRLGKIIGVKRLIVGEYHQYDERNNPTARYAFTYDVIVRVVDTETGEVIITDDVRFHRLSDVKRCVEGFAKRLCE